MPKTIYRCFYDSDDKEVWASYDGEQIALLLIHDIDLSVNTNKSNSFETFPKIMQKVAHSCMEYNAAITDLLEKILNKEHGIILSKMNCHLARNASEREYMFSAQDKRSADQSQYKLFIDASGNWFVLAAHTAGKTNVLTEGHIDQMNKALERIVEENGTDLKHVAKYTEPTRYYYPAIEDFQ